MKRSVLLATTIIVLGSLNWLIIAKEHTLRTGRTVLCELAPRDPRSIMQGDYMVLRYQVAEDAVQRILADRHDGHLVLKLDENDVATFDRLDSREPLAADEVRVRFRRRNQNTWSRDSLRIGAESYFFQEGRADDFTQAQYGELKVAPSGECILIGLRDAARQPL